MCSDAYVLVTAAKNEERYIEGALQTVIAQTVLPKHWIVVSDGSTDRTDEIVQRYSSQHPFIRLIRRETQNARIFSSQAEASKEGYARIRDAEFDFVGFLDADISFDPVYYEKLLTQFKANPRLGIGGGQILEADKGTFRTRFRNSKIEVAGAIQFFRRACYEGMGGLTPLRWGGHDAVADTMARKKGWDVRTFSDLHVFHHRPTGTAGSTVSRARFRQGMEDYFLGYHPLYELGKCLRRLAEPPVLLGSALRCAGYFWPAINREKRTLPPDFLDYLKRQQLRRVFRKAPQP
jgi:glycosyltransferase involved in cell wall biosynthesis